MNPELSTSLAALALIAAGMLIEARADDRCTWLVATVASKHFSSEVDRKGRERDYEERNWGLGGEHCLFADVRAVSGFYRNSNRVDSVYVGASWTPLHLGPVRAGFGMVVVSGYAVEPIRTPVPVIMIEGNRFGVNISPIPKTPHNAAVIGLQVKWRFR